MDHARPHDDGPRRAGEVVTGPFARVPAAHRRVVAHSSTAVSVALLVAIGALGLPLRTEAAPLGLLSLQLAVSPDVAAEILDSWVSVLRSRVLWTHGLDLVLPVAYALAIGTAVTRVAARVTSVGASAQIAAGAVLVAAIADQVENIAMALTIVVAPSWGSVLFTLAFATIKFATLSVAFGALAVTLWQARPGGVAGGGGVNGIGPGA